MRILLTLLTIAIFSTGHLFATEPVEEKPTTYDAIIVPGYPYQPDEKMNAIYKMRLHWAAELYRTGRTEKIIVSGSAVHSPYIESRIFSLYLQEMGVNAEDIITEEQAEHSLENVFYSLELASENGLEKVAVATDLFQSGMIQFLGRKHNLEIEYIPAKMGFIIGKKWKSFKGSIDPSSAFVENFVPLKERETREERMNGTRGFRWMDENELTLN
jgi:vancomycin permeability regulator SanA